MKSAIFIALCLAIATVNAYTVEDGVIVLTDSNFNDAIKEFDYILVDFYSPTCGPCKAFAPNYAAMAQQLAVTNPEIKLCKVDVTVEQQLGARFDIRWLPTVKFFTKGSFTPVHYEGAKNTQDILDWVLKMKADPSSVEATSTVSTSVNDAAVEDGVVVLTDSNFNDALKEFDIALVDFYAPWCGHCKILAPKYAAAAQQLATTNPEIKICKVDVTVEKGLGSKFQITRLPTLKLFIKGRSTPIPYEGVRETQEIVTWVLNQKANPSPEEVPSTPVNAVDDKVIVLTDSNFNETMEDFDYAFVEFYKPMCGPCISFAPDYITIADELSKTNPEIKICKVDITTEKEVTERYEIERYPTFKFFSKGSSTPITYEYIRDIPSITNWLKRKVGLDSAKKIIDVDL